MDISNIYHAFATSPSVSPHAEKPGQLRHGNDIHLIFFALKKTQ